MARDEALLIRLSRNEKRGFGDAAKLAGIGVSAWARERLRLAAIRELEAGARQIPFLTEEGNDGRARKD
jgi:hypothetical protein